MNRILLMQLVRYLIERKGVTSARCFRVSKLDVAPPDEADRLGLDEYSESPSSGQL